MKSYRAFAVTVVPRVGTSPRRILITDHGCDVRKSIVSTEENSIAFAIQYLQEKGIRVEAVTRAIRESDVRLLTTSDAPLR